MAKKHVYFFGAGAAEGNMKMKDILGGKGANLAEMAGIGLPVPPGFTVSTEVCALYYKNRRRIPEAVRLDVEKNLKRLEKAVGQAFGDPKSPLLVSVRSGARASMPGMMDTILNLGLTDKTASALVAKTGNERFVYDSYRRFVQMYGDVVLGLKPVHKDDIDPFEAIIDGKKRERGVANDLDLTAADLKDLVARFKAAIKDKTGQEFPQDPKKQLWGAIGAVFGSWMNDRAIAYRKLYDIPEAWGTAVNVQLMVFGNMGADSGTGVAFTRDPATGENVIWGEYLVNAQGEDVVAGIRTPTPIADLRRENATLYEQFEQICHTLEKHFRDTMDVEFTFEKGRLYFLQCRVGKRTTRAAVKIAVDMVREGLIDRAEALRRVVPQRLDDLLHPHVDPRVRTPEPVAQLAAHLPDAFHELDNIRLTLEKHFTDVQDFEFTIQDGKVFMLQTRNGKRTGMAAVKFACDMVKEKL
ncbi:MAG TPA: PEP/pyruvate-binding domain-containing protein, partial [Terriglobales bacterium]|nr:PEP/pyruvate-binding domain-containing protein [Terriglobales bacterium]